MLVVSTHSKHGRKWNGISSKIETMIPVNSCTGDLTLHLFALDSHCLALGMFLVQCIYSKQKGLVKTTQKDSFNIQAQFPAADYSNKRLIINYYKKCIYKIKRFKRVHQGKITHHQKRDGGEENQEKKVAHTAYHVLKGLRETFAGEVVSGKDSHSISRV